MRQPYQASGGQQTYGERIRSRQQATDFIRQRGTEKRPSPPRGIITQSAPRGVQISWALPPGDASDIAGWRIYKGDENTLLDRLPDRGTRQYIVPATAGATVSIFVSSVNALGVESTKVQVQGSAISESGAPAIPSLPADSGSGQGSDLTSGLGTRVAGGPGFKI